jgi:superfamily II DNA/RNA helicase
MPTKEEIEKKSAINSFDAMNLSKPLIKALSNMGLTTPTEIQVYYKFKIKKYKLRLIDKIN